MIPDLHDPAVALTDGFLAVECAVLAAALRRDPLRAAAFAALGASSLFGGITHGFFPAKTATPAGLACWLATLSCLGLAAACFWSIAFELWPLGPARRRAATVVVGMAWVAYGLFIALFDHRFLVGVAFYLPPLVFLGVVLLRGVSSGAASALGPIAIGLMLLGSALQQAGIDLLPGFNHNALYHLVQAIALPMLFVSLRPAPAQS